MKCSKFIVIIVAIFIFLSLANTVSASTSITDIETDVLDNVSLEKVQQHWSKLIGNYGGYLPDLEKSSLYDFIKNNGSFSVKNTLLGVAEYLFHEIIVNGKLLGMLLMLTLFSVLLQTMHTAFERSMVSKIAYFTVYLVLLYIALNSFYLVFSYTKEAIDAMSTFLMALLPLILGLMATFGSLITVSFFHPIIVFLIFASGVLVSNFILPLLFLSALLLIVSSLTENYQVTHLANLLKSISLGVLGVFLTIFLGVLSVQGAASAIQDGVAMKTAKFITGNFIPIVGRTFTDAADTILSASLLLKNSVGIVGLIIIVLIALFPAIKILIIAFIYKVAAAVLQPLGDGPIITSLNVISKYIMYILASLIAVTIMFFLAVVILVVAGNITLMLR